MTRPGIWPLVVIGLGIIGLAGIIGAVAGLSHWYAGIAAVLLCIVPAFMTVGITGHLATRTKFGGLIGMAIGTGIRTVTAVGGGAAAFWSLPQFHEMKYGFWAWLLGTYLVTLITETAILARFFWATTKGTGV